MTPTATRSTFGSVYFRLGLVAVGVIAGFFFLSRFYVAPKLVEARADSLMSLFRSHEDDLILNKTRSLRDELRSMNVIGGDQDFHNYTFQEKSEVESALGNCEFYSPALCLGKSVSVFLQGNSTKQPKEQFNFAVVLDSDLTRPPAAYYGIEAFVTLVVGLAFWFLYRAVAKKEDYLLSRLQTASAAFSRARNVFSIDGEDEFDTFGRSAENLVRGLEDYKSKFERKTRLEQLGLIVGQASHDLKAPFNEAENFLSQMPHFLENSSHEQILEGTGSLIRRMQHGREALNSALKFAKQSEVARDEVSLREVLRSVIARAGQSKKLRNLSVEFLVPQETDILGDQIQLETAFLNLLENTADEKPNARVNLVFSRLSDTESKILYTDDGSGIPQEALEEIFEPLVTFKASGTGLGLSSTREIFSVHGGSIRAMPHRGGAQFEITLPLLRGANA